MDFESQRLTERLASTGFDPLRPAFISWLGVSMYLTMAAIAETCAALGTLTAGTELVVDHILPRRSLERADRRFVDAITPWVAASGEPWRSHLGAEDISAVLRRNGFGAIRHIRQRDMIAAALWRRADALRPMGISVVTHATLGDPATRLAELLTP